MARLQPMISVFEWLKIIPKLVFRSAELFLLFTYVHVHKDFAFG